MQCGKSIVEYTLYIQEPYTYVYMKDLIKEDQISLIERSNGSRFRVVANLISNARTAVN